MGRPRRVFSLRRGRPRVRMGCRLRRDLHLRRMNNPEPETCRCGSGQEGVTITVTVTFRLDWFRCSEWPRERPWRVAGRHAKMSCSSAQSQTLASTTTGRPWHRLFPVELTRLAERFPVCSCNSIQFHSKYCLAALASLALSRCKEVRLDPRRGPTSHRAVHSSWSQMVCYCSPNPRQNGRCMLQALQASFIFLLSFYFNPCTGKLWIPT